MSSDWLLNFVGEGRVRCHGAGDIKAGANRDWARVSGNAEILQKLKIWASIPKGEVVNDPTVGCCLYNYIFAKMSSDELLSARNELAYDLANQLPELNIYSVDIKKENGRNDTLNIKLMTQDQTIMLALSQSELNDLDLVSRFTFQN
jgi:phage baseplate assembly protein W